MSGSEVAREGMAGPDSSNSVRRREKENLRLMVEQGPSFHLGRGSG